MAPLAAKWELLRSAPRSAARPRLSPASGSSARGRGGAGPHRAARPAHCFLPLNTRGKVAEMQAQGGDLTAQSGALTAAQPRLCYLHSSVPLRHPSAWAWSRCCSSVCQQPLCEAQPLSDCREAMPRRGWRGPDSVWNRYEVHSPDRAPLVMR